MALVRPVSRLVQSPRLIPEARLRYEELKYLDLKYPMWPFEALFQSQKPTGYQPPLGLRNPAPPFLVERIKYDHLPIDVLTKRLTQHRTRVHHIVGDLEAFKKEFEKVTGRLAHGRISNVEVGGNHFDRVAIWLWALGF